MYLSNSVKLKREHSKNHKNSFPRAHLEYIEREMDRVDENIGIASLAVSEGDRVVATTQMQVLT